MDTVKTYENPVLRSIGFKDFDLDDRSWHACGVADEALGLARQNT